MERLAPWSSALGLTCRQPCISLQAVQNNGTLYMHAVFEATVLEKTEADLLGSPRTLQWVRSWRASPTSNQLLYIVHVKAHAFSCACLEQRPHYGIRSWLGDCLSSESMSSCRCHMTVVCQPSVMWMFVSDMPEPT